MENVDVAPPRQSALRLHQMRFTLLMTVVLTVVAALVLSTFRDYGIGWDGHVQAAYGQKLLSYYLSAFADRSAFTYMDLHFYGGFFDLIAAAVNRFSPLGEFETRHLMGGVIFIVGLAGAWRLTRLLANERAAFIAVVALAATPMLYGQAFINPKDSPFAWLLVWATYFACRILDRATPNRRAVYVGFAVCLGMALGVKVFAGAYGAYLALIVTGSALAAWKAEQHADAHQHLHQVLVLAFCVAPLAILIMVLFWPWVAQAPENFFIAVQAFLNFPHKVPVLWDGEVISSLRAPREYLVLLLGLKLPEYILLGLALALAGAGLQFARTGQAALGTVRSRQLLYVAMTALVPIAAFIVLRPTAYNGLRQYLFIVPPLVILAALGLDSALTHLARWRRQAAVVFACLLGLAIVRQTYVMAQVHPYEYVAFNAFGGDLADVGKRFELDYWGTSLGEAARKLVKVASAGALQKPRVYVCGDRISFEYFARGALEIVDTLSKADFFVAPLVAVCQNLPHKPAHEMFEVGRAGANFSRVLDLRPSVGDVSQVR